MATTTEVREEAAPKDALTLLNDISRLREELAAAQKDMSRRVTARLIRDLPGGSVIDTRSWAEGGQAKVLRGTANQGTHRFKLLTQPIVNVDGDHPSMYRWSAKATPLREKDDQPYNSEVLLVCYIHALQMGEEHTMEDMQAKFIDWINS